MTIIAQKHQVLRDTREQRGWEFPASANCLGTREETLKTGDYTLAGYEKLLVIERKASTAEWAKNVLEARFERELQRLDGFRWPFIICEFTYEDLKLFPERSGIPKSRWRSLRLSPNFLIKKLDEWQLKYRAKIILAGPLGRERAGGIFKRVIELCPQP